MFHHGAVGMTRCRSYHSFAHRAGYAGLNATASAVHKALTSHLEAYENNAFSGGGFRMLIDSLDNGAEVHTGFAEIDVRPRKLAPGIFRRQYLEEHFSGIPFPCL